MWQVYFGKSNRGFGYLPKFVITVKRSLVYQIKPSSVDKFFRAALYKAELDGKAISLNSVRKSFIYELRSNGVCFSVIQELTGLKSVDKYSKDFGEEPIDLEVVLTRIFDQD